MVPSSGPLGGLVCKLMCLLMSLSVELAARCIELPGAGGLVYICEPIWLSVVPSSMVLGGPVYALL